MVGYPGRDRVRRAVGGPVGGYAPLPAARWMRRNGGVPSMSGDDPIGHILFIEHDLPDVAAAARWYLEPVDYLAMRFTGVAAATPASMAGAWLTDNRHPDLPAMTRCWSGLRGSRSRKLPPLLRSAASWAGFCRRLPAGRTAARGGGGSGNTRPPFGRGRGGRRRGLPAPPGHLHHQLDQLPVSQEEDRSVPADDHCRRRHPRPQPGGQQPERRRRGARVAA